MSELALVVHRCEGMKLTPALVLRLLYASRQQRGGHVATACIRGDTRLSDHDLVEWNTVGCNLEHGRIGVLSTGRVKKAVAIRVLSRSLYGNADPLISDRSSK